MELFYQLFLLITIAVKSNSKAQITFMQIDNDDHSFDCNTVITVNPISDNEYKVQYQDLTFDPSVVTTIRINKNFVKSYIKEVMNYDCLKGDINISVDRVLFDGDLYHVGSIATKLTSEFWN